MANTQMSVAGRRKIYYLLHYTFIGAGTSEDAEGALTNQERARLPEGDIAAAPL